MQNNFAIFVPVRIYGVCHCGKCEVVVEMPVDPSELVPRVCGCDYCQANPSTLVSSPDMAIEVLTYRDGLRAATNGSEQATFYHCNNCDQLVAVAAEVGGESRGAVNGLLFRNKATFAEPVAIQPKLLSAVEKAQRWQALWGRIKIYYA